MKAAEPNSEVPIITYRYYDPIVLKPHLFNNHFVKPYITMYKGIGPRLMVPQ